MSSAPSQNGNGVHPVSRRVLVVDDEPGLRLALGRGLARYGYEVFLADSGADALAQLESEPGVDVVLSDITMPAMTGIELATEILRRHPGIPILFITGSTAPAHLLDQPLVGMISKPAPLADVRRRLEELIDAAAATGRPAISEVRSTANGNQPLAP